MKITESELIKKYPKIFQPYEGNPYGVNWSGVPKGWLEVVDKLCGCIQDYIDNTRRWEGGKEIITPQVRCSQVKEKFGGLRFYYDGGDDEVEGMVRMAEWMCENKCQECGSEEDLGKTRGWISVLCKTCSQEQDLIWESNKKANI